MKKLTVTKTFLPPFEDFAQRLRTIWDSHWLTNNGPLLQELEAKYADALGVPRALCVSNGTVALQLAVRALRLNGQKIITTPYSFVATAGSIIWENCQPVFVDVRPTDFNIDPEQIEAAITADTKAIMAVHVYGHPCDVTAIQKIADRHKLPVIYDAAHAFGVRLNGRSIAEFGDVSTFSLHATKLVHAAEGGLVCAQSSELLNQIDLLRAFGMRGDQHFAAGLNAKMSELHAALGLSVLPFLPELLTERRRVHHRYLEGLAGLPLQFSQPIAGSEPNYAYFAVLLESNAVRERVYSSLMEQGILTRRYFWPSLNTISYMPKGACPVSEDLSNRVLCLPMYAELSNSDVDRVTSSVRDLLC